MEERIREFLSTQIPGASDLAVQDLRKGSYGASMETFYFTAAWTREGRSESREMVLRRNPEAGLLASDREREYRVIRALEGSDVPVPRTFGFSADPAVLDRPFFIMEKVEGFVNPSFQRFGGGNEEFRAQMVPDVVKTLVTIHNTAWQDRDLAFLGLPEEGAGHALREIERWKGVLDAVQLVPEPLITLALQWLDDHPPARTHTCLLHGDFKMDNIQYGRDAVVAVFDWEMAALGDPLEDVGWFCMPYYAVEGLLNGLVEEDRFLQAYEDASGIHVDRAALHFWKVLATVKMAAITLTGIRGFCDTRITTNVMAILALLLPRLLRDLSELLSI